MRCPDCGDESSANLDCSTCRAVDAATPAATSTPVFAPETTSGSLEVAPSAVVADTRTSRAQRFFDEQQRAPETVPSQQRAPQAQELHAPESAAAIGITTEIPDSAIGNRPAIVAPTRPSSSGAHRVAIRLELEGSRIRCPYCHDEVRLDEDWRACAGCLARHHASCWAESGRCGTCHGVEALTRSRIRLRGLGQAVRTHGGSVLLSTLFGLTLGALVGFGLLRPSTSQPRQASPLADQTPGLVEANPPATVYTITVARPAGNTGARQEPERVGATAPAAPREEPIRCRLLRVGFEPAHFAALPDGRLLLARPEKDEVVLWDWDLDQEIKRIQVAGGPCHVFVRGKRAFVCCDSKAAITEIDLEKTQVVNTIALPAPHPYYVSGAANSSAPLYVACGEDAAQKIVKVDLATEQVGVVLQGHYLGALTIAPNGKTAVKQSPGGDGGAYSVELKSDGSVGNQLAYQHSTFGLLVPSRKGDLWFAGNAVWNASLTKELAKLDPARVVAEHPSAPLVVTLGWGEPMDRARQGTVTFLNTRKFASHFARPFSLPMPTATPRGQFPRRLRALPLPVVGVDSRGTTVVFSLHGEVAKLTVSPDAYSCGRATRLIVPVPATIPADRPWRFNLEVAPSTSPPRFKALELPPGCTLDGESGELSWPSPAFGEHDLAIKVFVGADDYFLLEEHLRVRDE